MLKSISSFKFLWFVIISFIAYRLFILLGINPDYFFVYPDEELYRGVVARDLIQGLKMPLIDYRADEFTGGFYIISILVSFVFRVLGPTLFALKLTPILISLGSLILFYKVIKENFCENTARFFCYLFIFAPFSFTYYTMTPLGDHAETIFFTALSLHFFFKILRSEKPLLPAIGLGLTAGFATWFAYIYTLTIATIGIYWLIKDRSLFTKSSFWIVLITFFVGFSPWLIINQMTDFSGLSIREDSFGQFLSFQNLLEPFIHWNHSAPIKLLGLFVPYHMSDTLVKIYLYGFLTLFIVLILFYSRSVLRTKKISLSPIALVFIYLVLFVLALQISNYRFMRYRIPAAPFLFLFVAYTLSKLGSAKPNIKGILLGAILLFNIIGNISVLSPAHAGLVLKTSGAAYLRLPYLDYCTGNNKCLDNYEKIKSHLSHDEKINLRANFAHEITSNRIDFDNLTRSVRKERSSIPKAFENYFDYYLGGALFRYYGNWTEAYKAVLSLKSISPKFEHYASIGILEEMSRQFYFELTLEQALHLAKDIPEKFLPSYWQMATIKLLEKKESIQELLNQVSTTYHSAIFKGVGIHTYQNWKATASLPYFLPQTLTKLQNIDQEYALKGLGFAYELTAILSHPRAWKLRDLTHHFSENEIRSIAAGRNSVHTFFQDQ